MTNDNWAAQRVIPPRAPVPTAPRHAPVSPATTAVFGRPDGVDGSFDSEASAKAATAGRAQPTIGAE